jgi:hypothetical protein
MSPNCDKQWSRKFLVENLTQTFVINEWTKLQEKICFDKEKALLPATMVVVETRKKKNKILESIRELEKKQMNLRKQLRELDKNPNKLKSHYNARVCSKNDCRGYLNDKWHCSVCDTYTCKECNVNIAINEEHTCNTEDVETFSLLKKETKACPTCNTNIFKIDGCDQMWCTQCHTAFSWRTGRIETHIHNPHYYEFYRNNGNVPPVQGVECGRGIEGIAGISLLRGIVNHRLKNKGDYNLKLQILQIVFNRVIHLDQYESRKYNTETDNLELRVKYLMNEATEDVFKYSIQMEDKKNKRYKDIYDICQLFLRTYTDMIYKLESDVRDATCHIFYIKKVDEFNEAVYNLKLYCDGLLYENKVAYGNQLKILNLSSRRHNVLVTVNTMTYLNRLGEFEAYPGKIQTKDEVSRKK